MSIECPQNKEANLARVGLDGKKDKLDEIIRTRRIIQIQNISSENWIPNRVKSILG